MPLPSIAEVCQKPSVCSNEFLQSKDAWMCTMCVSAPEARPAQQASELLQPVVSPVAKQKMRLVDWWIRNASQWQKRRKEIRQILFCC